MPRESGTRPKALSAQNPVGRRMPTDRQLPDLFRFNRVSGGILTLSGIGLLISLLYDKLT